MARLLGAGVYGIVVLATTIMLYAGRVSDCGVDLLGVHDVAHDPSQLSNVLPSFLGARLLMATALVVAIAGAGMFVFPQPDGAVVAVFAFTLMPIALGTRWALLGLEQTGIVSISRTATEGVTALLIVLLVRAPGDLAHIPLASIVGESIGAFLLLRALPRQTANLRAMFRLDVVRSLYRRSWRLIVNVLFGLAMFNSDLFFLRVYRGSATVGYYAAAYALVSFFVNIGYAYSLSLLPVITRLLGEPAHERSLYHSAIAQVFAGIFPITLGGCLVASRLVPVMFGAGYRASVLPLQILLWSLPVALFYSVARSVLIAHGQQDKLLRIAAWAVGVNLTLNFTVIPAWGMTGAAVATVVTESILSILLLRFIQVGGLPMPTLSRFWRTLLAGGVMAVVVVALRALPVLLTVAAGGSVYAFTLYLVGGIRLRRYTFPELTV